MSKIYDNVLSFKKKYPMTIAFRLKKHCDIVEKHLNPGEEVIYAFPAQKNASSFEIFFTNFIAIINSKITKMINIKIPIKSVAVKAIKSYIE